MINNHQTNHTAQVLGSVYRPEKNTEYVSSIDPVILRSWRRCVTHYNLEPSTTRVARILTNQELENHRLPVEEFLHIAKSGLSDLYRQVNALNYVILLTDQNGITVDYIGNDKFDAELKKCGLYIGADWNEMHSGTNGVGICSTEMQAVTVHQDEHFDLLNTTLSCTAAPVFDPEGKPLAVLDVSTLNSPKNKDSQYLLLQLVKRHAQIIENANFLYHFQKNNRIVRFGPLQEYVNVNALNMIAVDESGIINGINTCARKYLTNARTYNDKNWNYAVGKNITHLFDCKVEDIINVNNEAHKCIKPTKLLDSGDRLYFSTTTPLNKKVFINTSTQKQISTTTNIQSNCFSLDELTDSDPVLQSSIKLAKRLVHSNINFLIRGDTGSGKEVLARAIHNESNRSSKPFIAVNCAAIPESLIESELFGHKPGAFTGARNKGRVGLIEKSSGGTLFLDEIGDMPIHLQTRLLRTLSEREVMPLGSDKPVPVNLNVISATHKCIDELIHDGKFREDLYFRLAGATLPLPPLKERKDKQFIIMNAMKIEAQDSSIQLSAEVLQLLMSYSWPGNIRELRNLLRIAYAFSDHNKIVLKDLPDEFILRLKASYHVNTPSINNATESTSPLLNQLDQKVEKLVLSLRKNKWNITETSQELGISRATIYRKMKKFNIVPPNELEY